MILERLISFKTLVSNVCRHLRLTEMLRANSRSSELVVMTLPLPKRGVTSPALYTAWLDMMTKVTTSGYL